MSMYSYCMFMYLHRASWHYSATLTDVFPFFFLSCKANARVKPAETGHGPHSSKLSVLFYIFFIVLCIVFVQMCTVLLPPGGYPVAVNRCTKTPVLALCTVRERCSWDRVVFMNNVVRLRKRIRPAHLYSAPRPGMSKTTFWYSRYYTCFLLFVPQARIPAT
jgi:magnesium-transporting ATPase (P-type)